MRHGAKVKLCSNEGCTKQVQRGGLCMRHGTFRTAHDESTAFGSGFDETTANLSFPNQSALEPSIRRQGGRSIPGEVAMLCQETFEV